MAEGLVRTGKLVTVFGGSGFVGRSVVKALANDGWRVRVASRRPSLAFALQPSGKVGQIAAVQANLRYPDSIRHALDGADAAINLVGLLAEGGKQTFDALHADGARAVAEAARAAGIDRFVQMSAIGAAANSASAYARTKAAGEAAVREILPGAVIVRPSVVFGPEDKFFNRFAAMARIMPALPLIGGGAGKLQPVFVGDVAQVFARAADGLVQPGTTFELGGPTVSTMKEILTFVLDTIGRKRPLVSIPFPLAELMGLMGDVARVATFGLTPEMLDITRDQVELLKSDNVVSDAAKAEGRTLEGLGIVPESYQTFVPTYLYRFRKTGQYANQAA